jgi:hypothetical protein
MTALLQSLLAILEGRPAEAAALMEAADTVREPEILIYFARHFAYMGLTDRAIHAATQAQQAGFCCAPQTLRMDPWFGALRKHREFASLLSRSDALAEETRRSYEAAGLT